MAVKRRTSAVKVIEVKKKTLVHFAIPVLVYNS